VSIGSLIHFHIAMKPRFRPHKPAFIISLLLLTLATASGSNIHEAAKAGDAATVRAILQTNTAAASLTNSSGETALHLGAGAASSAVVEALLAAKAPVNAQAQAGTALAYAILYRGAERFVGSLAKTGITNFQEVIKFQEVIFNPEIKTMAGRGSAVDAVALLPSLLEIGQADPAQTREELKVVELLLAAGADPNAPDASGITPVHCAAFRPQPEFLQAVLEKGGNLLAQTRTGETPLHYAASLGSPATVKLLLDKGARVGKANRFGNTPIFFAVARGNPEIVRLLLERGAFADDMNNDGGTPLNGAVRLQNRALVSLLLDQGQAAVDGRAGKLGETALHTAASLGDADMLQLLLEHKADLNATDKAGFTPLLNAVERGHMAIVEILVQQGANLNARAREDRCAFALAAGSTNHLLLEWLAEKLPAIPSNDKVFALQSASMHGRLANVRWLLGKGVPADATNSAGTALQFAAGGPGMIAYLNQQNDPALRPVGYQEASEADYVQIVSLLLTNGAEVNVAGADGRTPLHNAAAGGSVLITEILLRHKADIQARTSSGKTPLHPAAALGDDRLVELLLAHGAVIEAKDNAATTPLMEAAVLGNSATVKSLLAHGGDVSARDRNGATPLHWAAMTTNAGTVALLLDAGAGINALDRGSRTPLHLAAAAGRDAVVKLLLERKADVTVRDANWDTPTDLARKNGFPHIVTMLSGPDPQRAKQRGE
jgi:ankyrin repeat protein